MGELGPTTALGRVSLAVESLDRSVSFYRDALGMRVLDGPMGATTRRAVVGYGANDRAAGEACVEFCEQRRTPAPTADDAYWKIGITVPDVDHAQLRLRNRGVAVSHPAQFLDVGYLCHLTDPDGYAIELLQHRFAENHRAEPADDRFALGGRATLGQITLRVDDAQEALGFYCDQLGMRLLSRQVIEPHRFTLYFVAFTTETPPEPDVDAIANREWLWQRPYTTLELQHRWDRSTAVRVNDSGFLGIGLNGAGRGAELSGPSGVRIGLGTIDSSEPGG